MDPKREFQETIFRHYLSVVEDKINVELLKEVCNLIAEFYYEQYSRFTIQYPKSTKRYSTFKLTDLEHPATYETIIRFFKEKLGSKYPNYAKVLLHMNDKDFNDFEKSREDFYKMF